MSKESKYYFSLHFSQAVDTVVKEIKKNPKRMQRYAKKQMQETDNLVDINKKIAYNIITNTCKTTAKRMG